MLPTSLEQLWTLVLLSEDYTDTITQHDMIYNVKLYKGSENLNEQTSKQQIYIMFHLVEIFQVSKNVFWSR
jgi:hypothetical protein